MTPAAGFRGSAIRGALPGAALVGGGVTTDSAPVPDAATGGFPTALAIRAVILHA